MRKHHTGPSLVKRLEAAQRDLRHLKALKALGSPVCSPSSLPRESLESADRSASRSSKTEDPVEVRG